MRGVLMVAVVALVAGLAGCASLPRDARLANDGYAKLAAGDFAGAEPLLKEALEINADNPYAMLNMGVVYENTGRKAEAKAMYEKVIASGSTATAKKSTKEEAKGLLLVDIAKRNIEGL